MFSPLKHSILFSYHAVGPVADRAHLAVEARGRGDRGEEGEAGDDCDDDDDDNESGDAAR